MRMSFNPVLYALSFPEKLINTNLLINTMVKKLMSIEIPVSKYVTIKYLWHEDEEI
jgi:hypothetical protein